MAAAGASLSVSAAEEWRVRPLTLPTRWTAEVGPTNALPEHPRPQLVRDRSWNNLNGLWHYAITPLEAPPPGRYQGEILVPYPVESALSGVGKPLLPHQALWYQRTFVHPFVRPHERVLLHFGAVDWQATVYVNGKEVVGHAGGYESFSVDITDVLQAGGNELLVRVFDPTDAGSNPRGKQALSPEGIMYTAVSGIWQTVWLETVPRAYVEALKLTPDVDNNMLRLDVRVAGDGDFSVVAIARSGSRTVATATGRGALAMRMTHPRLWSPDDPFLYDLEVQLRAHGRVVDRVKSYFGMRKIEVRKDERGLARIFLNGRYTYNLGTLDQGYWPDGLYTAPTDAALKFDIEAAKAMGFNTIRKHVKVESARWYYHCDRLGMLVWQDLVEPGGSEGALPGGSSQATRRQFEQEVATSVAQLHNHPSVVVWTLFNEGWGAYDQARLSAWLRELDATRLVNGHSGANYYGDSQQQPGERWPNSDLADVHAYPSPTLPDASPDNAKVLGEFGGIGAFVEQHLWDALGVGWGYAHVAPSEPATRYENMINELVALERQGLSGSIYTQSYDIENEQNGLLTYDREVIKIPVARLRRIHAKLAAAASSNAQGWHLVVAAPDLAGATELYAQQLAAYEAGNRDPLFLRRLALTAMRRNDQPRATEIGNAYIGSLALPYSAEALKFILKFTRTSKDLGFVLLKTHAKQFNALYGADVARAKLDEILEREERPVSPESTLQNGRSN
jgi:hypothetical protein